MGRRANTPKNTSSNGHPLPEGFKKNFWKAGKSGNPSGRPKGAKGLAKLIQKETKDGKELVEAMRLIAQGKKYKRRTPSLRDIIEALKWLADRGYGKALQSIEVSGGDDPVKFDLTVLNDKELNNLTRLLNRTAVAGRN